MDVSKITLFSDIDGTLGIAGQGIPRRNYEAIERFTRAGGKFALSTGRWITDVTGFVKGLPINAVSILNNGAAFYDFEAGKCLSSRALPDRAGEYVRDILSYAGEAGLLAVNPQGYVQLRIDNPMPKGVWAGHFPAEDWKDFAPPYLKFLFLIAPDRLQEVYARAQAQRYVGVDFVCSSDSSMEMVPSGVSKGAALRTLCEESGLPIASTAFIGDSYNDAEMLRCAGITACPSGAPDDLKALCDVEVGPCMGGAVADFIEYLERL